MQIGIVGLPFSGKSTLFDTLLSHKSGEDSYKQKTEAERGIINVPDERLNKLTEMFNPEKQINATIEYIKVPGIEGQKGNALPSQFLSNVKYVDTILLMIRNFENDIYPHPLQTVDPVRDINFINSEFFFHDLATVENRIGKLEKLVMKTQNEKEKRELKVLQKCHAHLEQEKPLRELEIDEHEELLIRGFQFITIKPILYVVNINESDIGKTAEILKEFENIITPGTKLTALSAEIEKEISQLNKEDAELFLEDLGISNPATQKMISESYELMGLQSFFTVGDDECRSWPIKKGTIAQKAAGEIHTDLEKGFIRAEVASYNDLMQYGSLNACKDKGVLRLEGKEYIVKDGDILNIRFNV
ncbi:MAG: redox-regulated ATPase YchF [Calditrichia bacterium]|nr:redox-regulated ATPase YchF [Calditrichia bacterium]